MSCNYDYLLMLIERTRVLGDEVRELHFEVLSLEAASVALSAEASVLCTESFKLLESLQKVPA